MTHVRRSRAAGAVVIASLACAAAAPGALQAQTPVPPPLTSVTVTGTGIVKPTPLNRKSNASIAKAVRDAKAAATPLAIADGRARAANLAALSGMVLGQLVSVSEGSGASPVFFGPFYGQEGTFGPGRFCGNIRRPVYRRTADGKRKRVAWRTIRSCRVPAQVSASLGMTFATSPAPSPRA